MKFFINSLIYRKNLSLNFLTILLNIINPFNNYKIKKYIGRFGNNVQQITSGIIYAKLHGANFYSKKHPLIDQIKIVNSPIQNFFKYFSKYQYFINVDMPYSNYFITKFPVDFLRNKFYIENANLVLKNVISKKIKFLELKDIDEDTLVIHIRGGEIFNGKNKYLSYVQNPIGYFELLIKKFDKVIIVSENDKNPVISPLLKNDKVSFQSTTMENDFNTLISATNLATSGVGTFAMSAALMSRQLKNFYCTDIFLDDHLNPNMLDKNLVNVHMYRIYDYIKIGNWVANKENIDMMLNRDIKIVLSET